MKNRGYTLGHSHRLGSLFMPKQNVEDLTEFGKRLSALRKQAGYTQTDLAKELGISQRMISYYESDTEYPPASLLPDLVKLLGVTSDELLGITPLKKTRQPDTRLLRRMQQIEKLDSSKKRQVLQMIDTLIEHAQLTQQTTEGSNPHANA